MLKQENLESQGKKYLLNNYDVKDYGPSTFVMNTKYMGGEFRRVRAMMPFEYLDKRAKDFSWDCYGNDVPEGNKDIVNAFVVKFEDFRKNGKGLYIYSNTKGSGKTLLSCCLLNEVIERYGIGAKFINILDYLDLTKKGYSSTEDKEERDSILRTSLLVLDDMGVEGVSANWVNTTLYQLINFRYSNNLITIVTSNDSIEELKVDERIKDRINAMCIPIHMPEVSIRRKEASRENAEFLKSVM